MFIGDNAKNIYLAFLIEVDELKAIATEAVDIILFNDSDVIFRHI